MEQLPSQKEMLNDMAAMYNGINDFAKGIGIDLSDIQPRRIMSALPNIIGGVISGDFDLSKIKEVYAIFQKYEPHIKALENEVNA